MNTLYFNNIGDISVAIINTYTSLNDEFGDVSIIAKYGEIKEVVKELLCLGCDISSIDLHRENFEGYYGEYVVSLNNDGLWCEKLQRENRYLNIVSDVIYISNECNSKILKQINSDIVYAFEIDDIEGDEHNDGYSDCVWCSDDGRCMHLFK